MTKREYYREQLELLGLEMDEIQRLSNIVDTTNDLIHAAQLVSLSYIVKLCNFKTKCIIDKLEKLL